MKLLDSTSNIRQQHPGHFRRPEDGKEPFAHVNEQKLANTRESNKTSVYVNDINVATVEEGFRSDFPRLFDYDAGIKYDAEKIRDLPKENNQQRSYDKTGKIENLTKSENLVDQWA